MDVEAAEPRGREHPGGEDQAVGGNDQHVQGGSVDCCLRLARVFRKAAVQTQAARLKNRDSVRERQLFDRAGSELEPAT